LYALDMLPGVCDGLVWPCRCLQCTTIFSGVEAEAEILTQRP
jgi:hypothetical protein